MGIRETSILFLSLLTQILLVSNGKSTAQESIHECLKQTNQLVNLNVSEIAQWTSETVTYHLFQSSQPIGWCEAFTSCKQSDTELARVNMMKHDDFVNSKYYPQFNGFVWTAGRRKDFGTNWTWTNENLTDFDDNEMDRRRCDFSDLDSKHAEYASVLWGAGWCKFSNRNEKEDNFVCYPQGVTKTSQITWINAQKRCQAEHGRLATIDEFDDNQSLLRYWIGLSYRPWIWVRHCGQNDGCFESIVDVLEHIKTSAEDKSECLTIGVSSRVLQASPCSNTSNIKYFLCESGLAPTSTNSKSVESTNRMSMETSMETLRPSSETPPTSDFPVWVATLTAVGIFLGLTCIISTLVLGSIIARKVKKFEKSSKNGSEERDHHQSKDPGNDVKYSDIIDLYSSAELNAQVVTCGSSLRYEEIDDCQVSSTGSVTSRNRAQMPLPDPFEEDGKSCENENLSATQTINVNRAQMPLPETVAEVNSAEYSDVSAPEPADGNQEATEEGYCQPQPQYLTTVCALSIKPEENSNTYTNTKK